MLPVYATNKILKNTKVYKNIFIMTVSGNYDIIPGQFFMVRSWGIELLLSRPLSVFDAGCGYVSFLYEIRGRGTKILSGMKAGDSISMLGPLGNGFDLSNIKGRAAMVAGGIGLTPMLYTAKKMVGCEVDLYAGFREDVYIVDKFKEYVDNIYLATDSGKAGHKGFITDIFDPKKYSVVLCCGPWTMMEKVIKKCIKCDVPIFISMERRMACGVGACLGCTCKTKNGNKRVCKDGPVFNGRDVIIG